MKGKGKDFKDLNQKVTAAGSMKVLTILILLS